MWIKTLATLFALQATSVLADGLLVFAAASLKGPMDRVAGAEVTVSYGGSGTLARQIQQGAPADVVILANSLWMDVLEKSGHVVADSRKTILSNRLVLVSSDPTPVSLTEAGIEKALGDGRLAIGRIRSVPAGQYGQAALTDLGLWASVAGRLAEVDNVRAALVLAARGEVPLALVYASDAKISTAAHVVAEFPERSHPVIRYEAAQIAGGTDAGEFLSALEDVSDFEAAGFLPAPD